MRFAKRLFPILIILLTVLAFACPALAENEGLLVLPKNMQFIKSEAFKGSTAFERVIITEGAHTIESNAFAGSNLQQIQLPVSMTKIADDAFGELKPLVIAVENTHAYGWANGLGLPVLGCTVNAEENRATITSYNGTLSTLYLPDEVMGCPVTAINGSVFSGNKTLEKVILPGNLRSIGANAFNGCENLNDVVFNDGLTTIEGRAFENCKALIEADLPDSVQIIRYEAFLNCTSLNFFDYPTSWANTSTDNDDIFKGCASLKSITVPDGVTTLPVAAFEDANKLESVILPESMTSVSNYAFAGTTALKSIEIPASVETIGEYAFSRSGLETVTLPESLTAIKRRGFSECKSLTDVAFNDGLITIYGEVFMGCSALVDADLPDSVQVIMYNAFRNCSALESFDYPTGWVSTDSGHNAQGYIFAGCQKLTTVVVPEGVETIPAYAFDNANYLSSVSLPESLTSISDYTFHNCTALKTIEIPDSVATIGDYAFSGSGLETVTLPESLTTIEREGFSKCANLTDVVFNEGLTSLCDGAFMNCTALVDADLPDSVQIIEHDVFRNCSALTTFRYPMGWVSTNPGYNAEGNIFFGCVNFTTLVVPEGVETIPDYAFDDANYLTSVSLPSTLTTIGYSAFCGTSSLKSIDIPASVKFMDDYAFSRSGLEAITLPEKLTSIERECFSECKSLTDVVFHDGITTLCDGAFMNCTALLEADIPDSVHTMEYDVFNGCTALKSFDYPTSLENVNCWGGIANNFKGCSALESITVPEGVTSIPESMFSGSNYLKTVDLPSTLTSLPQFAFESCSAMGDIYIYPRVSEIDEWAFYNPGENLRILCEWGTAALAYAKEQDIAYYYLSRTGTGSYYGFFAPDDTVYKGDPVWMYGYVRGSIPVESITATLYDADGGVLKTVTIEPNVTDYNVSDGLSGEFDFGGLELGNYSFKLVASTAETTETLVSNSFTVKKPPVRLNKDSISLPEGIYFPGDTIAFSGVLSSNYAITNLSVAVAPISEDGVTGASVLEWTVEPGTKSYDLAAVNLDLEALEIGAYAVRLTIKADGQLLQPGYSEFQLSDFADPEEFGLTADDIAAFVANEDSCYVLSHHFTYASQLNKAYEATLSGGDKILHGFHDFWKEWEGTIRDGVENRVSGDTSDWNQVELYKVVISDFIKSTGAVTTEKGFGTIVSESIKNGVSIAESLSGVDQFAISLIKCARNIDEITRSLDFRTPGSGQMSTYAEHMAKMAIDYEKGLVVLEALCTEIDPKSMDHDFQTAVAQMIREYERGWESVFSTVFNFLMDNGTDAFMEGLLGSTLYIPYKIVSVADGILEAVGYYEGSEAIEAYKAKHTLYSNARDKYVDNFEIVFGGDHSEDAITRLLTSFDITRQAALRELKYALELEYSEGFRDDIRADISYYQYLNIKDLA